MIQAKKNQPKLYEALESVFMNKNSIVEWFRSEEKSKGRKETRTVSICKKPQGIDPDWIGVQTGVCVKKTTIHKQKLTHQCHYYISNLPTENVQNFAQGARGHWSIENQLHWVKDVIQNEDNAQIAKGNGIETLSIIKNIAINCVRKNYSQSVKQSAAHYAANIQDLLKIMRT